ncbi:MAG: hypothetical protein J6T39_01695 [Clostridia bacterium]|nr:hypothetical protein [Clostridia bacterium]
MFFSFFANFNTSKIVCADGETELVEIDVENLNSYNFVDSYNNEIYLTSSQKITYFEEEANIKQFSNNNINEGFYNAKFVLKASSQTIYVFDELKRIQVYDEEFEYQKTFQYVSGNTLYNLGEVSSVCKDFFGNVFFADYTNNKILTIDTENNSIAEIEINIELNLDAFSKISVNPNGNIFAIFAENKIFVYDFENGLLLNQFSKTDVIDIKFDYLSNLFLIFDDKIEKYAHETFVFEETKNFDFEIRSAAINIENGCFYILNENLWKFFDNNFSANPSDEIPPFDINKTELDLTICCLAKTKSSTLLYSTCVSFSASDEIEEDTVLICLEKNIEQNSQMCYCLAKCNGIEKFGYINKSALDFLTLDNSTITLSTVCKNVDVYVLPTKKSKVFKTIKNEDSIFACTNTLDEYADENGNKYFAVSTDDGIGYVEQKYMAKLGNFESTALEVENYEVHEKEFVAYIIIVCSLMILTIAICVVVGKNQKLK